jgi:hypothetical protein
MDRVSRIQNHANSGNAIRAKQRDNHRQSH